MRTMVITLLVWAALGAVPVEAQHKPIPGEAPSTDAAITPDTLKTLEAAVPMTPNWEAERNALANQQRGSLTINPDLENRTDMFFTHVIKSPCLHCLPEVLGRRWLFAGLNLLRPEVIAKHKMKD